MVGQYAALLKGVLEGHEGRPCASGRAFVWNDRRVINFLRILVRLISGIYTDKGHETKHKTRRHGVGDHTRRAFTLPTVWMHNLIRTTAEEVDQQGACEHRGQTGKGGRRENPCPGQACRE